MAEFSEVHIRLTPAAMERYCEGVLRSARSTAHALGALVAVDTFLATVVSPDQRVSPAFATVRQGIQEQIDRAQRRLREESARLLVTAVQRQEPEGVARVHAALSRSGFRDAVGTAARALSAEARAAAAVWAGRWCREARHLAEAASGYPDALDFPKAGIDPAHYAALSDLEKFLEEQVII